MYQHVCCKTMAGLQGLFDEQARERGICTSSGSSTTMDPRTVSRDRSITHRDTVRHRG